MKLFLIGLMTILSMTTFAHEIEGTLILKGSIKTKVLVDGAKTTCRVKVSEAKNLLQEDSFGNPAYLVKTELSLDGSDIKFEQEVLFNNLFSVNGGSEVRDLEYASKDGATMKIDREGRIKLVTFLYQAKTITCSF